MKDKLELKDIAIHLPYGLEGLDSLNQKVKVVGVKDETYFVEGGNVHAYADIKDLRPILFPIECIEEGIEINGKMVMPMDLISEPCIYLDSDHSLDISYKSTLILAELGIDVNNLIGKGLAVSKYDIK